MPRLYLLSGADVGKSFEVGHGATFGRSPECTVHLRDASISRLHARLELDRERWTIVDTQSRNGLSMGGQRVPSAILADGDEFTLGDVLLRFRGEVAAIPAPVAVPRAAPAPTESDSIELEGDWSESSTAFPTAKPLAETAMRPAAPTASAVARAPAASDRSRPVLQYQRVEPRDGFVNADLSQLPGWARFGLYVLAALLAAGIFFIAFKGTLFLKERAPGNAPELPDATE